MFKEKSKVGEKYREEAPHSPRGTKSAASGLSTKKLGCTLCSWIPKCPPWNSVFLPVPKCKNQKAPQKYNIMPTLFTINFQFSSVQSLSRVWLFVTPWIAAHQASLSITNSQSLFKLMHIELVMPSSHPILCRPLLLLPSIPPSIRVLSNESTLRMRWPKYWELQLQHKSFQWTPKTDLQDGLVGSPCSPRDSQESSPTSQFKSINSSKLSFLHSTTLTSIHDHWKNHSLDQMDLCWQSNVPAF